MIYLEIGNSTFYIGNFLILHWKFFDSTLEIQE